MRRYRLLTFLSATQLGCGLAGMALALRRRHPYDILWFRGRPDRVARDSILIGTALSAPVTMLVAQAALTVVLAARPNHRTARTLGVMGAGMVPGYVGERHVRRLLSGSGWNPAESPTVLAGAGLAAAMAAVGLLIEPGRGSKHTGVRCVTGRGVAGPAPAP